MPDEPQKQKQVLVLRRSQGKLQSNLQPIVLEYKERNKGKKKKNTDDESKERYSEGLEDVQRKRKRMEPLKTSSIILQRLRAFP